MHQNADTPAPACLLTRAVKDNLDANSLLTYDYQLHFDANLNCISILSQKHNLTFTPNTHYIILASKTHLDLENISCGDLTLRIQDRITQRNLLSEHHQSVLSGYPCLVMDHQIPEQIEESASYFFNKISARTSLGITQDGCIISVVSENEECKIGLKHLLFTETKTFLKTGKFENLWAYRKAATKLTFKKFFRIFQEELCDDKPIGLTMLELAYIMKDLGCMSAINFDGGRTSRMILNGKTMNKKEYYNYSDNWNDYDFRDTADAIVFVKK